MRYLIIIFGSIFLFACKTLDKANGDQFESELSLYVDELAQLYTISNNNTILKYDQDGNLLFEYSDNTLGPITNFDVTNPLQLLVYHENFQRIKIFDRTLTLNSEIDLNKLNLFEVHAAASSNDNRIWVFDELNQELLKIDKNGVVQGRNNDLRLRLKTNANPYYMVEYQNKVYAFDKEHGILIFNNFGEYLSKREFNHSDKFRFAQGLLFYKEYTDLVSYQLEDGIKESVLIFELISASDHYILNEKMIYLEGGDIRIKDL